MSGFRLMEGEQIVHRGARLALIKPFLILSAVTSPLPLLGVTGGRLIFGFFLFAACANFLIKEFSTYVITNKRVILQTGVLTRRSFEMPFSKIESVYSEANAIDSMANCGSVVVCGTGGTKEVFPYVVDPETFKMKIQEQIELIKKAG